MSMTKNITDKFELLADLGTLKVPAAYDHETQLDSFTKKYRSQFYYYNPSVTDENFGNPTVRLVPGQMVHVRAFRQMVPETLTSEERMEFLAGQKALLTGAQGATLVFEQMRDLLPKGYWYVSFDEKAALWSDEAGHGVPILDAHSVHAFGLRLGRFSNRWRDVDATLCFCKAG